VVACGAHPAGVMAGDSLAEVAGIEVAVFAASDDVDVVHVLVSDDSGDSCRLHGGP